MLCPHCQTELYRNQKRKRLVRDIRGILKIDCSIWRCRKCNYTTAQVDPRVDKNYTYSNELRDLAVKLFAQYTLPKARAIVYKVTKHDIPETTIHEWSMANGCR